MGALRRQRRDDAAVFAPEAAVHRPVFEEAGPGAPIIPSPARNLQQIVEESWGQGEANASAHRWSPQATLLFTGSVSLLLWGITIGAVFAAIRLLNR